MIYRFGHFTLDDSARELRLDGELVDTKPKTFRLLTYLIENRDRAVSKVELLSEIWPRSTVSETTLARCVMKARRAIGDKSAAQSMIRTLRGYGYRFVADLETEVCAPAVDERQPASESAASEAVTAETEPHAIPEAPGPAQADIPVSAMSNPVAVDWVNEPLKPPLTKPAKAARPYRWVSTRAVVALIAAIAIIALGWLIIFLRVDARLAIGQSDNARAAAVLSTLRARADEAWFGEDDELLATVRRPGIDP